MLRRVLKKVSDVGDIRPYYQPASNTGSLILERGKDTSNGKGNKKEEKKGKKKFGQKSLEHKHLHAPIDSIPATPQLKSGVVVRFHQIRHFLNKNFDGCLPI